MPMEPNEQIGLGWELQAFDLKREAKSAPWAPTKSIGASSDAMQAESEMPGRFAQNEVS